jgi:hypothetical protein
MKDFAYRASWRKERPGWHSFLFLMAMVVPMAIYILTAK